MPRPRVGVEQGGRSGARAQMGTACGLLWRTFILNTSELGKLPLRPAVPSGVASPLPPIPRTTLQVLAASSLLFCSPQLDETLKDTRPFPSLWRLFSFSSGLLWFPLPFFLPLSAGTWGWDRGGEGGPTPSAVRGVTEPSGLAVGEAGRQRPPSLWSLWVIAPRGRPPPPHPSRPEVPLSLLVSLSLLLDSVTLVVMEEQGVCTRRMKPFPSPPHIVLSPFGNLKTRNVSKGYPRWELDPRRGKMLNTEEMPHSDQGWGPGKQLAQASVSSGAAIAETDLRNQSSTFPELFARQKGSLPHFRCSDECSLKRQKKMD